ncbi:MAG: oligosaccharide flippase family protein [Firmicutes bacterium]|nr:oligosaccharide flippase family protein [Bacillota bacterium]
MGKTTLNTISLGTHALRLTAIKTITILITMFIVMLLSRYQTVEEYGIYAELLLVSNLGASIMIFGLPNSINYFLARADTLEDRQCFLSVYYSVSTILSIAIGFMLVASIPEIEGYFHNTWIHFFWYFLAIYPWASIISSSLENTLIVYQKTQLLLWYRFLYSTTLLLTIVLIQWIETNFVSLMVALSTIHFIFALIVYRIVNRVSGGFSFSLDISTIQSIFRFSIPIGLATAVGTLSTEMDKLLIGYMMDIEQLAIYTNAAKELPLSIVASSITAVLLPQIVRLMKDNQPETAIRLWGTAIELVLIIITFIVSCVFVFAEDIISLLYSDKYLPGVNIFRVYSLNLIFRCTYFGMILNACGKTKQILYCSVITLVLNLILNPLCFWGFGIIGPAIATLMSISIMVLLQLKMTSKILSISMTQYLPLTGISNIFLVNIVFSVFLFIIGHYFNGIYWGIILSSICGIIYFSLMKNKMAQLWKALRYQ